MRFFRKIFFHLAFKIYSKTRYKNDTIHKSALADSVFVKTHKLLNEKFDFLHVGIVGENWYENGNESRNITRYKKYVKEGDVVLDIGAHQGYFSLLYRLMTGSKGKVYAIEPFDFLSDVIRFNASLNKFNNIFVLNVGIGESPGVTKISSISSKASEKDRESNSHNVVLLQLDDFVTLKPNFIKMDIEGFELEAFRDSDKMLNLIKPIFQMSLHPEFIVEKGSKCFEILDKLAKYQYVVGVVSVHGEFQEIDINQEIFKGLEILAIHKDEFESFYSS